MIIDSERKKYEDSLNIVKKGYEERVDYLRKQNEDRIRIINEENNRSMRTLMETQNQETQRSNSNHSKEIIDLTTKYRVLYSIGRNNKDTI